MPVPTTYEFQQQVRQMQANVDLILTKAPVLFGLIGVGDRLTQTKFEWQNDYLNSDTGIVKTAAAVGATDLVLEKVKLVNSLKMHLYKTVWKCYV